MNCYITHLFKTDIHRNTSLWSAVVLILLHLISLPANAQEQFGLKMSNYGGIDGASLNPSSTVTSKTFLDLNLAAGFFSIENNFLFIHHNDYQLTNFIKKNPELPSYEIRGEGLDYLYGEEPVDGFQTAGGMGPSFSMTLGRHAFGLSTKVSSATSVNNLPRDIAVLMFEGLDYTPLQDSNFVHDDFDMASLTWWEIGANYSWLFHRNTWSNWSAGINLRYLSGYAGATISSRTLDYLVLNDSIIKVNRIDAGIGFSVPVNYDDNTFPSEGEIFKGSGFAMDLGISYRRNRSPNVRKDPRRYCQYQYQDYIYELGFSMVDLGKLTFRDHISEHVFDSDSVSWNSVDTLGYQNINDLFSEFSSVLYMGDRQASNQGSSTFGINLATAISFQADFNYYPNWYLGGALILPVSTGELQLRRPAQAMLSLRYETPEFEFNIPVSLYDFEKPRIGLYARFYYFSIGTDKLGGLFGFNDFYGMDIYFSIKYQILKGYCNRTKPYPDCRHLAF